MQRHRTILAKALADCEALQARFPTDSAIVSVRNQLQFLIELSEGKRMDWNRLNEISIGVLAVREIEPLSARIAESLYEVVEAIKEIQTLRPKSLRPNAEST